MNNRVDEQDEEENKVTGSKKRNTTEAKPIGITNEEKNDSMAEDQVKNKITNDTQLEDMQTEDDTFLRPDLPMG
eukprot:4454160-Ditylum_brightwellii.AAC.1